MNENDLARARAQWNHRGSGRPKWAVAPGENQESVWDYPRPPRLDPDSRLVRVVLGDTVIAESHRAIRVLETASPPSFYIPPQDVRTELLTRAPGASLCEWKGSATYWSLCLDGQEIRNVAWSYEQPFVDFASLRGYLSFYPGKLRVLRRGRSCDRATRGLLRRLGHTRDRRSVQRRAWHRGLVSAVCDEAASWVTAREARISRRRCRREGSCWGR